jgi:TonB family protein
MRVKLLVVFSLLLFATSLNAQIPGPTPPNDAAEPLKSVVVEKTNGDRLTGFFAGADENAVKIRIAEAVLNIPLGEILTIRIGPTTNLQLDNPSSSLPKPIIVKARALSLPHPEYPKEAKKLRAGSIVKVEISINEVGRVTSARAFEGDPIFYPAAEKAALKGIFEPMTVDGKPTPSTLMVKFGFRYER